MEKQPCHAEWGRLKIRGRPLMSGAAFGSSQPMRVACRTLPCLVHIFEDANLVSIWRFPADPVFLLFGPSFQHTSAESIAVESKSSDCSILVITSDGSVWLLDWWKEYDPSTERLTKKGKEAVPEELQKAVQEMLVDEGDNEPLYVRKSLQPKQGDNLEDVHHHGSHMSGSLVRGGEATRRAEHNWNELEDCYVGPPSNNSSANCTSRRSGLVDVQPKWATLSSDSFPRFDSKLKVKLVSQEALLSYVPGTSAAAFGPEDSVALLGVSGAVKVIQVSLSNRPQILPTRSDTINVRSEVNGQSSCLLYASLKTPCKSDEKLGGYVALLEAKFFQNLFGCPDNMTSPSGILHGDTRGYLYTSLVSPARALSHTRLLCDFGQPVVAVLTVPATATSGKQDDSTSEENSKITEYHGSSLLVIGQSGKVILITGMKETIVEMDDNPFWPTSRSFSWRSENNTLTARQLNERNLEFCEWEVFSPISSASMLGPHRLCYCTTSEIFYTDLIEQPEVFQIYPHHSKTKHASADRKDSVSLSLLKLSQKLQPSVSDYRVFKKELVSLKVPLVDAVVAIAGRGICGGVGSSRPLVALTARGRLLGVEVSNHVSSRALSIAGDITKSWRSLSSRMEERIQSLLQVVGEVAKSTDVFQRQSAATTFALNELATALPLVEEICLHEMRTRRPDASLFGEPPSGRVSSFLTVTDHTPALLCPEHLSFGSGIAKFVTLHTFHPRKVKIAIRLCNQSLRFLSPYWSLLLELRSVSSDQSVHFSLPINGGLGLTAGAEYTHELIAQFPGRNLAPVLAYLFLCHDHNSHQLISKSESSVVKSGKAFPHTEENELCSRLINSSLSKMGTVLGSPGSVITTPSETNPTSRAVCLVLSQYRIDLLSLLAVTPPRLGADTWVHLRIDKERANMDSSSLPHRFLGRFSSKFILVCVNNTPYTVPKESAKFWRDFYLDDLLRRGSVSKAAQKVSVSAFDSETFSVSLMSGAAGEKCTSVEVLLESSSFLLGSYLREAVMWRLEHCKDRFILKECSPWQPTKKVKVENMSCKLPPNAGFYNDTLISSCGGRSPEIPRSSLACPRPTEMIDFVKELDERLAVILELWGNVLRSAEKVQFTSLLNETFAAIQDVMLAYRACKADEPNTTMIK